MSHDVLGISWLNGRFHATVAGGRRASASWSSPTAIHDEVEFSSALAEAVAQVHFAGSRVMLVIDHRSLIFHVQETPPAAGKLIDQLLQRTVERSQFFEEAAAWNYLALESAKTRQRFLLALIPQSLLLRLADICDAQGLELAGVFPLATVFDETLQSLQTSPDEHVLIAADLGSALHLVLGKSDGSILFCRTVVTDHSASEALPPGSAPGSRAVQEINRTLHFAQQQFGSSVTQLFVVGDTAFASLHAQPIRPGLRVQQHPRPDDPLYYAARASALSPRFRLNLARGLRRASRQTRRAIAVSVAALLSFSTLATVWVETDVHAKQRAVAIRARQLEAQDNLNSEIRRLQEQATRWRGLLQVVTSTNAPAVPELFARYVASVVPESIRLTQLDVSRTTSGWSCRIEGVAREQPAGFIAQMAAWDHELETNIFKFQITDSTHRRMVGGSEAPPPTQQRPGVRNNERAFFVTGDIK